TPGPSPPRGVEEVDEGGGEATAGTVTADCNVASRNSRLTEKKPCRQRIVECRWEWVLRGQTVSDRQRAHFCSAASLRHHSPVAANRTRAVSTAMEKQQNARLLAACNIRPFAWNAVSIDRG